MLDTFRKHSNSTLIYLVFGALIFVFAVSFGQGSQGWSKGGGITGSTEFAARVNDETVSIAEFHTAYRNQLADFEARSGQPISDELAEQLGLKKQILDRLVNTLLLKQAAKKSGVRVGDAELAAEITKVGAFQKDGAFDAETYANVLGRNGTSKGDFEEKQRETMIAQKMVALITQGATVSDDEVRAEFNKQHDRADISFVRFAPAMFAAEVTVAPTDAELEAYAQAHAKEIEDSYNRNSYRYHKPQRYQARNILVRAPEGAPESDDAKAKARANEAYQALKGGKDFAEVAKQFSDDTATKDKGGDLGIFNPAGMDKRLDEAVSKAAAGSFTEPVRTHFGYQIIKVEKVVPPEDKKLEEVRKEIALELKKTEAGKALAQQKAEEALHAAQGGKSLAEQFPAEKKDEGSFDFGGGKLQVQETGPFALEGDFVPKLGPAPEIAQAAFSLTPEHKVAGKVFEQQGAFYVVELKSREQPNDADFAKQAEELRAGLLQRRQNELLTAFLKELRDAGKVEENQALVLSGRPVAS